MPLNTIQRARWSAALRSLLRAATGREINRAEIDGRVSSYLNATVRRGLGPGDTAPLSGPLFLASDYSPKGPQDPLGGPDGRDVSRAWAAVREDLDCVGEGVGESERRISQATTHLRDRADSLTQRLQSLLLSVGALEQQAQSPFFGGSGGAAGQASLVWDNMTAAGLVYPQTTGILLSGLGVIPSRGSSVDSQTGGTMLSLSILSSSDSAMVRSPSSREWAENPFSISPSAWTIKGPSSVSLKIGSEGDLSLLEIRVSQGTTLVSASDSTGAPLTFESLKSGGSLWVEFPGGRPAGSEITLTFTGATDSRGNVSGSILGLKAHSFSLDTSACLVWGPFTGSSSALFTVTLEETRQIVPAGSAVSWQFSTASADGPWTTFPGLQSSVVLRDNGRQDLALTGASPDPLTLGFYRFPVADAGSLQGGVLTAGVDQAKVEAFQYNWSQERDPLHRPQDSDWASPKGIVRTVAMGPGPSYTGHLGVAQTAALNDRLRSGSSLTSYTDDKGRSLTGIALTSTDPNNPYLLQPGYNYRFTWGLWSAGNASLTDLPIGLFNPEGTTPGGPGYPYAVNLNGSLIYRSATYFTDYREVSPAPAGYGSSVSQYPSLSPDLSQGSSTLSAPAGSSWPPYCGRMTMVLRPGWNELSVLIYVPVRTDGNPNFLGRSAVLVFGPNLLDDPLVRYQATGIQTVQGWKDSWSQVSEFDLRNNTPLGMKETWAWVADSGRISGLLLNHDPGESETGFLSLDNVLTGNTRTHHLSYLTDSGSPVSSIPGADPLSQKIWVRASLSTSNADSGPLVSGFKVVVN